MGFEQTRAVLSAFGREGVDAIAKAEALREAWKQANFEAFHARRRAKSAQTQDWRDTPVASL